MWDMIMIDSVIESKLIMIQGVANIFSHPLHHKEQYHRIE